ncbi:hypothetical protein [Qingshengfaniella alkalisoli]|uniref:Uncharacterized protein n=1 Tax=Qingshengfaniella alkalisoli TaxID=2599296 RepID=A0A5B8I6X6_9RHOB|nr:hypothetical protein [Qingshengfaniella alkalisoli]QDY69375.1 hypothetical protein FPZ52_06865 [Qingshengfaniella alkalisoli]
MFSDQIAILRDNGKGMHAYRKFAQTAYNAAKQNPDHAAAYMLIASAADGFLQSNERMPISVVELDEVFNVFNGFAKVLTDAFSRDDATKQIRALNSIAGSVAERGWMVA